MERGMTGKVQCCRERQIVNGIGVLIARKRLQPNTHTYSHSVKLDIA